MADWRRAAVALFAGGATVAAALGMPVTLPKAGRNPDPGDLVTEAWSEPGDLGTFLASRRWGVVIEEKVAEEPPPPGKPALNPAVARMGFVGLIVTGDESAVLLESPESGITRVAPKETLLDGRVLVSVTDNHLPPKGEGMPEEVLILFPPSPSMGAMPEAKRTPARTSPRPTPSPGPRSERPPPAARRRPPRPPAPRGLRGPRARLVSGAHPALPSFRPSRRHLLRPPIRRPPPSPASSAPPGPSSSARWWRGSWTVAAKTSPGTRSG